MRHPVASDVLTRGRRKAVITDTVTCPTRSKNMGFGTKVRAMSRAAVLAQATPPSGASQEAIYDQRFDTQTYPAAGIRTLTFFSNVNADKTLSNMEAAGQFPAPQSFRIHQVTCDIFPAAAGLSSSAGLVAGNVNDMQNILFQARPTWQLSISSKLYGPYSLTVLHGTGGPQGFISGTYTAPIDLQHARNETSPGWDYCGSLTIPEQTAFSVVVNFQNTLVPIAVDHLIRVSIFGIMQRRVL